MKKIILGLVGVVMTGYFVSENYQMNDTEVIMNTAKVFSKKSSKKVKQKNETVKTSEDSNPFNKIPKLEDIEAEFRTLSREHLKFYLNEAEKNIDQSGYLEKANLGSLTVEERKALAFKIRRITVLRKLLIEREIELLERELS